MAAGLLIVPGWMPALDSNGDPISGALLWVYQNGSTTPTATYTAPDLVTPHEHPVVADAAGQFPLIYADNAVNYTVVLTDADEAPLAAFDAVPLGVPFEGGDFTGKVDKTGDVMTGSLRINGAANLKAFEVTWNGGDDPAVIYQNANKDTIIGAGFVGESSGLIAKRAAGSVFVQNGGIFDWHTFSGATIGDHPTFTNRLRYRLAEGWTFSGTVAGADPVEDDDFVTKGWGEAHLGAGGNGFFEVTQGGPDDGTLDLTGLLPGQTIRANALVPGDDDFAIWEFVGAPVGVMFHMKPTHKGSVFIIPPDFYSGSCKIIGNYQPVDTGHYGFSFGPRDTLYVLRHGAHPDYPGKDVYEVALAIDQFDGRVDWVGANREPLATFKTIGMVAPYDEKLNQQGGDGMFPVNGTIRKPTFGGGFRVGIGDTTGDFYILLKAKDAETGEGLNGPPRFGIPHTNLGEMSTHHATLTTKVYKDGDPTKELVFPAKIPGGYAGPGSVIQGWSAQEHLHHSEVATEAACGGGATTRVTRKGTNHVLVSEIRSHDGAVVHLGKSVMEADGNIVSLAPGLNMGNIPQWNIPSLRASVVQDWFANHVILATPAENLACSFFASQAIRHYNAQGNGQDFYWRSDENIDWIGGVSGGSRARGIGTRPGWTGTFTAIEGGSAYEWNTGGRVFIANGATFSFTVPTQQIGEIRLTREDAHGAIYCVSSDTNGSRLLSATDATGAPSSSALFTNAAGSSGKTNVFVTGQNTANIQNLTGVDRSYRIAASITAS